MNERCEEAAASRLQTLQKLQKLQAVYTAVARKVWLQWSYGGDRTALQSHQAGSDRKTAGQTAPSPLPAPLCSTQFREISKYGIFRFVRCLVERVAAGLYG